MVGARSILQVVCLGPVEQRGTPQQAQVAAIGHLNGRVGRLPCQLPARMSTRITNEVPGVNRVVLDVTSKPSGTIKIVESPIIRPQRGSKR